MAYSHPSGAQRIYKRFTTREGRTVATVAKWPWKKPPTWSGFGKGSGARSVQLTPFAAIIRHLFGDVIADDMLNLLGDLFVREAGLVN
jgi:hypothetical protein